MLQIIDIFYYILSKGYYIVDNRSKFNGGGRMLSNLRKQALSGWLSINYSTEFYSPLKLQKFLFLYESYSKIEGDTADFRTLKGYVNGPVFSDVYGDYTYRKDEYIQVIEKAFNEEVIDIDEERAKFVGFLVKILSENELSDLTHELNIWKAKEEEIQRRVRQVPLDERDLTQNDVDLLVNLREMYPVHYIDSVHVIQIAGKSFIINKEDIPKLNQEQKDIFITLAEDPSLENPVYVSVSEDGVLLVD